MAARSERSLRRSSRRGEVPETAPVTQNQAKLNKPTKRARISSLSEAGSLPKKTKIEESSVRFKVPLRSRRYPLAAVPLQNGIESILVDGKPGFDSQKPKALAIEKRTLRSQDGGSRSKSELSHYFNNYDQMISLEPPKPGKLPAYPVALQI